MPPYVYLASRGDDSLSIFDAADPVVPVLTGNIRGAAGPNFLNGCRAVSLMGNFAVCACRVENSITVIDVTNPAVPTYEGSVIDAVQLEKVTDVHVIGSIGYASVPGPPGRLTIIDLSTPATPVILSSTIVAVWPIVWVSRLCVSGNYAYITITSGPLYIYDISNPLSPTLVTSYNPGGSFRPLDCQIVGAYCYVTCDDGDAFYVVDISDPSAPFTAGMIEGAGAPNYLNGPQGLHVVGNYAYICSLLDSALSIIDISDPTNPTMAGFIQGAPAPVIPWLRAIHHVRVVGSYAYIGIGVGAGDPSNGLTIIDVSNPAAPAYSSHIGGSGAPNWTSLTENVAMLIAPSVQTDPATGVT